MGKKEKKAEAMLETAPQNETRQILLMRGGAEYEIVSEDGRYYYCGMTQFRKSNPNIAGIVNCVEPVLMENEVEL